MNKHSNIDALSSPSTKRTVGFASKQTVHEIPRSEDDELSLLHWSQEELNEILLENRKLAIAMSERIAESSSSKSLVASEVETTNTDDTQHDRNNNDNDISESIRGLELFIPAIRKQRMSTRMQVRKAVLLAQRLQHKFGGACDTNLLAQVCSQASSTSEKVARDLGLFDERAVLVQENQQAHHVSDVSLDERILERSRRSKQRRMKKLVSQAA